MSSLTLAEILAKPKKSAPIRVHVPEWGGDVFVVSPSSFEMDEFNRQQAARREAIPGSQHENVTARIVCMVLCDESGTLLATPAHYTEISKHSAAALDRIWQKVKPWFGVQPDDLEAEAKNSQTTQGDDSISG
jgi:hypothetical protein